MYEDINIVDHNVEIGGVPFYAEEISSNESFPRREIKRTKIKSGTEFCSKGEYIPREYSFKTTIYYPEGEEDCYDSIFMELMSKEVEVISPAMGGMFKAQVIFKRSYASRQPTQMDLDVTVKEIPHDSLIPNDEVESPFIQEEDPDSN